MSLYKISQKLLLLTIGVATLEQSLKTVSSTWNTTNPTPDTLSWWWQDPPQGYGLSPFLERDKTLNSDIFAQKLIDAAKKHMNKHNTSPGHEPKLIGNPKELLEKLNQELQKNRFHLEQAKMKFIYLMFAVANANNNEFITILKSNPDLWTAIQQAFFNFCAEHTASSTSNTNPIFNLNNSNIKQVYDNSIATIENTINTQTPTVASPTELLPQTPTVASPTELLPQTPTPSPTELLPQTPPSLPTIISANNAELQKRISNLTSELANKTQEIQSLNTTITNLNKEIEKLKIQAASTAEEHSKTIAENIATFNKTISNANAKILELEGDKSSLVIEKTNLETTITALKKSHDLEKKTITSDLEKQLTAQKESSSLEKASLEAEMKDKVGKYQEEMTVWANEKNQQLETSNTQLEAARSKLSQKTSEATNLQRNLETSNTQLEAAQSQLSQKTSEATSLQSELAKERSTLKAVSDELSDTRKNLQIKTSEASGLAQNLTSTQNDLKESNAKVRTQVGIISNLKNTIRTLEDKIAGKVRANIVSLGV